MNKFWESTVPEGYYDDILISGLERRKGIQPNWHNITFLEVANYVEEDFKHLDYACGPGTFIGKYLVNKSTGVDISADQINFANKKNLAVQNNSKAVLAYTLNNKGISIEGDNEVLNENDLLRDIFSLNDLETDTVRLDASTIKQLFEDTI